MFSRLACLLLVTTVSLAAADAGWLEGRWMVVSIGSKPAAGEPASTGGMTMEPEPGAMAIEIRGNEMISSMRVPARPEPHRFTSTYVVEQATPDRATLSVTRPNPRGGGSAVTKVLVERRGAGLILTDEHSVTTVQPWDADAVAKHVAEVAAEAAQPAAAIADRPLSGTVNGEPWSAIVCRRSPFPMEEDGKRIRVQALAEKLVGYAPGTKPKLMISLPTTPGDYPLGPKLTITIFTPPTKNQVLAKGTLRVISVTDSAIEFALSARDGRGNEVNGTMIADITPQPAP